MTAPARDRYRQLLAEALGVGPDRVTLFARGRVALYAILRALEIGDGDEVITPAFTCVAVPNAIRYTGGRPAWVDIDPATCTIDPAAAAAAVTPRTRAILAQNVFGLSADIGTLKEIAERHGLTLIDDCAHGLGGRHAGRPNGTAAPVSFFSTQWSKPVSTGLGGFAVALDHVLATRLRRLEAEAVEPSTGRALMVRVLAAGRERAGGGRLLRAGRDVYRRLSHGGFVPGSSDATELVDTAMPNAYFARLSEAQARLGADRIRRLGADVGRRRSIASRYTGWMRAHGRTPAPERPDDVHPFLRYPIRVTDRQTMRATAEALRVDLGDWFVSPIHPVTERLDRWGYEAGMAPNAERACREIVNLPTDPAMRDHDVRRVLEMLDRTAGLVV